MAKLPGGTVTFLLTDVEGSTALWEEAPEAMRAALNRHDVLFEAAIMQHGGQHIRPRGEGDSRFAVFASASGAVAAALSIQEAFAAEDWPTPGPVRVRIGLHTGEAELRDGDYYGSAVNRCARIRGIGHGGQILISEATAALARDDLASYASLRDLGSHRLKDLARPERVFQLVVSGLPSEFAALSSLDARPNNLPSHSTPLLKREREVADARARLLRPDVRLLTLTGPGGTGKTRLGLQVAAEVIEHFDDGVFFVALEPTNDAGLVASMIAQTVGVRGVGGRDVLATLVEYLRDRQLLLLLDNFEQVLAAVPVVSELLGAGPRVKILVTSRAALQIRGEHEFPVPPLSLPDRKQAPTVEALSQYGAVALFIERASAIRPDFTVTAQNASAVAEICARVDGLPLAIELAATRIRLLSPQAMLTRLERRLPLLIDGAQDLPARQQTLRSTIAWSYDLLNEREQTLFRRLAIFVGGFTLEAAERVASGEWRGASERSSSLAPHPSSLDVVASLVAKSLLWESGQEDEPRFSMLHTIREYGQELLEAGHELEPLQRRHVEYYLDFVEQLYPRFHGLVSAEWSALLEAEHDNLRAALTWSLTVATDLEAGPRLAGSLWQFWHHHGHFNEGRQWLERMLGERAEPSVRARVLGGAGQLAHYQGDYQLATAYLEEARSLWQQAGDDRGVAWTLHRLGNVAQALGDFEKAESLCSASVTFWRGLGERAGLHLALMPSATLALRVGDYRRAAALSEEAASLVRDPGNRASLAYALGAFAQASYHLGDDARAMAACEEALALFRELGDRWGVPGPLRVLILVAQREGAANRVAELCRECLTLRRELGSRSGFDEYYEILAWVATVRGQPEQAIRFLSAAETLRAALGTSASARRAEGERLLATAREALHDIAFGAAWAEGRSMTVEQAIAYALQ